MPEIVERRAFPRAQIRLPFRFTPSTSAPAEPGEGWTYNLGEEGACLTLPGRLDEGAALRLVFQTDRGALELAAVVIWRSMIRQRGRGILHGVEFSALTPDQQQALRELLRSAKGEGAAAP